MKIIKDGVIADNLWTHIADDETPPAGNFTVSLARWQNEKSSLTAPGQSIGIRISSTDNIESLADDLCHISQVTLDMAAFTDGRSFTQARLLRERLGFVGEIRVRGDFLRDQMHFLSRMGVNAFEFPEGTNLEDRLKAFSEFSVTYQTGADAPLPLYRRRA